MRISDSEILAVIIGDAPRDVHDRVTAAIEANSNVARRHRELSDVARFVQTPRSKLHETQRRAIQSTMSAVARQRVTASARLSRQVAFFPVKSKAILVTAALFAVVLGGFTLSHQFGIDDQSGANTASKIVQEQTMVALGLTEIVSLDIPTPVAYASFYEAVEAAEPGSTLRIHSTSITEPIRVDKPMTLVAANGTGRTGDS